ncbi:unnamed protein product [Sphagnum troendelagicum]|uniref:Uncharacterized protein n=1 Tax=Sphagnum troendelagicum TaxID=128251 RepID=A0ABP0TY38_9BRYO
MKYNRRHGLNHVVVRFSSANDVGGSADHTGSRIKCRENLPLSFVPGWVIWPGLLRSRSGLIAGCGKLNSGCPEYCRERPGSS